MEITAIRHLPTSWNMEKRLQGRRDMDILPPNKDNLKQIEANLAILRKIHFDYILSSPLRRTQQTAYYYGFQPIIEDLLIELHFGPFEGRFREELQQHWDTTWIETPIEVILGEKVKDLEERICTFLHKYKDAKRVLLFGHGAWLRALISYHQYGNINQMNKITVNNNDLLTLEFLTVEV